MYASDVIYSESSKQGGLTIWPQNPWCKWIDTWNDSEPYVKDKLSHDRSMHA
jgi:hypothetical protein